MSGVTAGLHTITEQPSTGWVLKKVTVENGRKVSMSGTSVVVRVPSGNDTMVNFYNVGARGTLKVCKVAGSSNLAGSSWDYTAKWGFHSAQINGVIAGGTCVPLTNALGRLMNLPFGTVVTLTESLASHPGTYASDIVVTGAGSGSNVQDGVGVSPSVDVTIGDGNTVATFTNSEVPESTSGWLKVCKALNGGGEVMDPPTFHFDVVGPDGTSQSVPVVAGQCSEIELAHAGTTSITEVDNPLWYAPTAINMINGTLVSKNVANGTATVEVTAGSQSAPTVIGFTNSLVREPIEICKAITSSDLNGMTFNFDVNPLPDNQAPWVYNSTVSVVATYGVNACTTVWEPLGAMLNVSEQGTPSVDNTGVSVSPAQGGQVLASAPGSGGSFVVGAGDTVVTFTNAPTGDLKVCKWAAYGDAVTAGQTFNISVNGGPSFPLTAEPYGLDASCQLLTGVPVGNVTVSEQPSANFHLDGYIIDVGTQDGNFTPASPGQWTVNATVGFGQETEVDLVDAVNLVNVELCVNPQDTHNIGAQITLTASWSTSGTSGSQTAIVSDYSGSCMPGFEIPAVDHNLNPVIVKGTASAPSSYNGLPVLIVSDSAGLNAQFDGGLMGAGTSSASQNFHVSPANSTGIVTFNTDV